MEEISFNAERHEYRLKNGQIVPSVTQILQWAGLVNFNAVNPNVLERASLFGKAVHATCHLYDINDLDIGSLDPALKPYLDGWIKFEKDTGFVSESSEQIVYSKIYRYAGTYDNIGRIDSIKTLVDIKSGTTIPKTIALQTAGYMEAHNEGKIREGKIKRRLCVQLLGNGTWRPHEYKERTDFRVFTSCLNIVNWKKINNIKGKAA